MSNVRFRLTLFYAVLLAASSRLLLAASYLLVSHHLHRTLEKPLADQAVSALASQYVLAVAAVVLIAAGGGSLVSGEVLAPLARAIAARRRFVANASHELRTPMTAIRVAAESRSTIPRRPSSSCGRSCARRSRPASRPTPS